MSDYLIRSLAAACAPRIAAAVEAAVLQTVRDELPGTLESVLREMCAGETISLYVPKGRASDRRDRDNAIRSMWNGRNARELAVQFKLSTKQIHRIATGSL